MAIKMKGKTNKNISVVIFCKKHAYPWKQNKKMLIAIFL